MAPQLDKSEEITCDSFKPTENIPSTTTTTITKTLNSEPSATSQFTGQHLHVLIITPVFPPFLAVGGGVAITYKALQDKLLRRGHKVTVLSSRLDNVDHGTSVMYNGFPVIMPTLANLRLFESSIKSADVVVAPETCVLPFLAFLSHRFNTPLIMNVHTNVRSLLEQSGTFGRLVSAPVMCGTMRLASWLTARTFTTSPSYEQVLISRKYKVDGVFSPRIKTAVFENKNDSAEAIAQAREWLTEGHSERPVMIYVGRWSHEKRIDHLVRCKPDGFVLVIVGDGPIAELVQSWHDPVNGVVCKQGMLQQDCLRVLYKASDLLVSASAFETLGMTVAEAHLCGTAVAVQPAPGFVTQVIHGANGFLVDYTGDANEAKAQLVQAMVNMPSAEQVLFTAGKHTRWDAQLPGLEEEVERIALADRSTWTCPNIPMAVWWPFIIVYYVVQVLATFPFNRVLFRVGRDETGKGNEFEAKIMSVMPFEVVEPTTSK